MRTLFRDLFFPDRPCVRYARRNGEVVHVLHGTERRARQNAAMTGKEFHWHKHGEPTRELMSYARRPYDQEDDDGEAA